MEYQQSLMQLDPLIAFQLLDYLITNPLRIRQIVVSVKVTTEFVSEFHYPISEHWANALDQLELRSVCLAEVHFYMHCAYRLVLGKSVWNRLVVGQYLSFRFPGAIVPFFELDGV